VPAHPKHVQNALRHIYQQSLLGASAVLGVVYPVRCASCAEPLVRGELGICLACEAVLPVAFADGQDPITMARLARFELAGAARNLFEAGGLVQELVHLIKYHRDPLLAHALGCSFGERLRGSAFDRREACLVPVPLHPKKLRARGINQAEWFARGVAEGLRLPMNDLLIRTRMTPSQTGLDREGRQANVAGAFEKSARAPVPACAWIVDDVITTGATAAEAALCLRRAGCPKVGVLAIAVVVD
jgi:predicted amidophosphoribosyltransferase